MTKTSEVVAELQLNYDGEPWHGSPLRQLVRAVAPERVFTKPSPTVRSIAELLAHTIAWIGIVEDRLKGSVERVTQERDFPSVEGRSWADLLDHLDRAHSALLETVSAKDDADWELLTAGQSYSQEFMVRGLMHHYTYHAAQIAVLNRVVK